MTPVFPVLHGESRAWDLKKGSSLQPAI